MAAYFFVFFSALKCSNYILVGVSSIVTVFITLSGGAGALKTPSSFWFGSFEDSITY